MTSKIAFTPLLRQLTALSTFTFPTRRSVEGGPGRAVDRVSGALAQAESLGPAGNEQANAGPGWVNDRDGNDPSIAAASVR